MFNSFNEMTAVLTNAEILELVNKHLAHKAYQAEQHKKYNAKKNAAVKSIKQIAAERGVSVERLLEMMNER